jgi:hypothetical protein
MQLNMRAAVYNGCATNGLRAGGSTIVLKNQARDAQKMQRNHSMNRFATTPQSVFFATILSALLAGCGGSGDGATSAVEAPRFLAGATQAVPSKVQAPVNLRSAGSFALLAKTGITNVYASVINGDVGASPITGAAIDLTCGEVATGKMYTVDAAGPLPCSITDATFLTSAVSDMETAYLDAAGRVLPDFVELGTGEIGGKTLVPGLYKWGTDVLISTDVTLEGGPTDVWIFQISGGINQASATRVNLTGGALAKNVFWQSAGAVSIGTTAHFEGVVLAKTMVAVKTGASVTGRLLAQTAVTLQKNAITEPAK